MTSTPRLSVVMPVLNGEATIASQLAALASQTFCDWELVVSDNGSTDATREVVEGYRGDLPSLRIVDSSRPAGLGNARNVGVDAAHADRIAFCDCDDLVSPQWGAAMIDALDEFDVVGGRIDETSLNPPELQGFRSTGQHDGLPMNLHFLPYAVGANFGTRRRVVDEIGGWRAEFVGAGDDIDFSWRAQLAGFRLGFAPDAVVSYRYRTDLTAIRRQHFHYGTIEPLLYREFRGRGVPPPHHGTALVDWLWIVRHLPKAFGSTRDRSLWNRKLAYRWGRTVGSIRSRTLYP